MLPSLVEIVTGVTYLACGAGVVGIFGMGRAVRRWEQYKLKHLHEYAMTGSYATHVPNTARRRAAAGQVTPMVTNVTLGAEEFPVGPGNADLLGVPSLKGYMLPGNNPTVDLEEVVLKSTNGKRLDLASVGIVGVEVHGFTVTPEVKPEEDLDESPSAEIWSRKH